MVDLTPDLLSKFDQMVSRSNKRAMRYNVAGVLNVSMLVATLVQQQGACCYCGQHMPHNIISVEHKQPMSRGGYNYGDNIALACVPCNKQKDVELHADERVKLISQAIVRLQARADDAEDKLSKQYELLLFPEEMSKKQQQHERTVLESLIDKRKKLQVVLAKQQQLIKKIANATE